MLENNLTGAQHLGIPVTNLERSIAFYKQLGLEVVMDKVFAGKEGGIHAAMLRKNNLTIELYQLPSEYCQEIAARTDGHIDHIALNVIDINKALSEIKKSGLAILEEDAPVFLPFWSNGVRYFTVRGPDGEKVEFNQIL